MKNKRNKGHFLWNTCGVSGKVRLTSGLTEVGEADLDGEVCKTS